MKKLILEFLLLVIGLSIVSCGPSEPEIIVTGAWGRIPPSSTTNAAFYMDIHNEGSVADRLVSANTMACGSTQIHETQIDEQGVASMRHVMEIEIPASDSVSLEVGGLHIMCLNKQYNFEAGGSVFISLIFETSGELVVAVEMRED